MKMNVNMVLILFLLSDVCSAQSSTPDYQSVSGLFARDWISKLKAGDDSPDAQSGEKSSNISVGSTRGSNLSNDIVSLSSLADSGVAGTNINKSSGKDLWKWGGAPRGSSIVNGELVSDPNYLHSLVNLSGNWLGESYTDPDTGLPMETYTDPLTGKTYYIFLSPTTGNPIFSYHTYTDAQTGRLVYVYADPATGEEVTASSPPIDLINVLAENTVQTTEQQ